MISFQTAIVVINILLASGMLFLLYDAMVRQNAGYPGTTRRVGGTVLIYLASLNLVGASLSKFAHVPQVVTEMNSLNMMDWKLSLVAALELFVGLLFLVRPLRSIGLLLISSYLGGAICAHLASDQYFAILPGTLTLGLCWVGVALRHPEMLWSFREYGASRI
jgi:DoxX-like family